ncbi:hypothetical protein AK830_g7250 [Neonectria ditissima]|uniref:Uncharacterized protein n=1 Tax=Neonectria ditissima TaxID=78410 RepID=A0A0P7B058_9HYPO|nr:hypothetical protein AK830_g7250 [Neonectria ditissima]
MPATHSLFGRHRRFASRRLTYLFFVLGLFLFAFFVLSPAPAPVSIGPTGVTPPKPESKYTVTSIGDTLYKSILSPFLQPSHPPPRQKQDTYEGTSWWADWKWLSVPFSSSVTFDEERALLPPLPERPTIYCYYDSSLKKPRAEKDAESDLLRTWRRAWWAHGFRPIILSPSEAIDNPKYNELQRTEVDPDLKVDLMRWFAWESMGAGILADYVLFPMAPSDDPLLSYLRKGEYPTLTRWKGLDSGLLAGQGTEVNKILRALLDSSSLMTGKSVIEIVFKDAFDIDKTPGSLAYYTPEIIKKDYSQVAEATTSSRAKGLDSLNRLINAHLHTTWQSRFRDGIEVLQPLPDHTTPVVTPALKLAKSLGYCPENPIPSSCPPNIWRCKSCSAGAASMKINTPTEYRNTSRVFTLGTVPHPWTVASMDNLRKDIDVAWIRRESPRDPWLTALTQKLLGPSVSGYVRIVRFKQAVADAYGSANALWLTAEAETPQDLDWNFGFAIPHPEEKKVDEIPKTEAIKAESPKKAKRDASAAAADKKSEKDEKPEENKKTEGNKKTEENKKVDGEKDRKTEDGKKGEKVKSTEEMPAKQVEEKKEEAQISLSPEEQTAKEKSLLEQAKRIVNLTKLTRETRLRTSMEAWNLADTEAWKFTRAYLARRILERAEWEKEEAKYAGGVGSEKGRSAWSRWGDTKEHTPAPAEGQ